MEQNASKWDSAPRNPNAHWVKTRELIGQIDDGPITSRFTLIRAKPNGKLGTIFELDGDRLFSAKAESAIGKQVTRSNAPPAGEYTIQKKTKNADGTSIKNASGFVYVLKAL